MPSFIPATGRTQHVAGVCLNRIGVTRKSAGIRKPADLDGKKIAGGPGVAVHDAASILTRESKIR